MPSWLDPALAYVADWLAFQMRQSEQPGCVVAIAHKGRIVLDEAFGHANLLDGTTLTPRHRFRVASHSKTFTAAAIMKLRETGKVKLDDPVGTYVSGLHKAVASVTIAQLLSHSAGLVRDGFDSGYWQDLLAFPDQAAIEADLRRAPTIDPNTRFKYSNHGFALLGLAVQAITGEPYVTWVRREIVEPAGLSETQPDCPLADGTPFAAGHSGKLPLGRRVTFPGSAPTGALASATGFVSTAADLALFFSHLSPEARRSVLSVASRREMVRPQWQDPYAALKRTYGLGTISGQTEGWDWFGHSGGFQGYITRTLVVPSQALTMSVLTNAVDGLAHPWLDGILHILKAFSREGRASKPVASWTGRWWSVWGAQDLVPMGDKVVVAIPGAFMPFHMASELKPEGPDGASIALAGGYANHGESARRTRDKDGQVEEVWLGGNRLVPEARLAAELMERYAPPPAPAIKKGKSRKRAGLDGAG